MEAPDKLYLSHLIYDTFQYQIHDPDDDTEIEYVRKDAFVEKASEWLNNFYSEDRHCFLVKEDIDAFIKAMEE